MSHVSCRDGEETRRERAAVIKEVKLAWCTDIHLDFLERECEVSAIVEQFADPLASLDVDAYLISGDLSLAPDVVRHLSILDDRVRKPIYFVLGNHDFYDGRVTEVRRDVTDLCRKRKDLVYLTTLADPVSLTPDVALVGHDGWYDAMVGNPLQGGIVMSDWVKIHEFVDAGVVMPSGWGGSTVNLPIAASVARKLSFEGAEAVRDKADRAASTHKTVIVVTHVPPFVDVHRSSPRASVASIPWYTSKLMGDALLEVAADHPTVAFHVFCGHTHHKENVRTAHNLVCHVGASDYGSPGVADFIKVS